MCVATYTYNALNRLTGSQKTVEWTRRTYAKAYAYDSLGSVVNLTDQYGRVPAQVDYSERELAYEILSKILK